MSDLKIVRFAVRRAEAHFEIARQNRVLAEIALEEYELTHADKGADEGLVKLAEAELARAEDRVKWAEQMLEKGAVSRTQKVSEDLNLQKARQVLRDTRRRKIIADFGNKQWQSLRGDLKKAQEEESFMRSEWDRERADEAGMEQRVRKFY